MHRCGISDFRCGLSSSRTSEIPTAAEEQLHEEWRADERGDDADRQITCGQQGAREEVSDNEEDGADEECGGEQAAMRGAREGAHKMRDDESDEADDAAGCDEDAREEREQPHVEATLCARVDAERDRQLLAEE